MTRDDHLSTEYISVNDVQPNLKLINVYAQPEQKKKIIKQTISIIKEIKKVEINKEIIIAGDLNTDINNDKKYNK